MIFLRTEAFCLPQKVNLPKICGSHKSDHKLDICGRFCDGFVSHTKAPLFPVYKRYGQLLRYWELYRRVFTISPDRFPDAGTGLTFVCWR